VDESRAHLDRFLWIPVVHRKPIIVIIHDEESKLQPMKDLFSTIFPSFIQTLHFPPLLFPLSLFGPLIPLVNYLLFVF
jgi:hypothetical protein